MTKTLKIFSLAAAIALAAFLGAVTPSNGAAQYMAALNDTLLAAE